jgi:hypothetical protein
MSGPHVAIIQPSSSAFILCSLSREVIFEAETFDHVRYPGVIMSPASSEKYVENVPKSVDFLPSFDEWPLSKGIFLEERGMPLFGIVFDLVTR